MFNNHASEQFIFIFINDIWQVKYYLAYSFYSLQTSYLHTECPKIKRFFFKYKSPIKSKRFQMWKFFVEEKCVKIDIFFLFWGEGGRRGMFCFCSSSVIERYYCALTNYNNCLKKLIFRLKVHNIVLVFLLLVSYLMFVLRMNCSNWVNCSQCLCICVTVLILWYRSALSIGDIR